MLCEMYNWLCTVKISASFLKIRLLVIVCYFVNNLVSFAAGGGLASELRKEILSHYNKSVSPGFEESPSDVGIFLYLTRIVQFDEPASTLTVEAYLYINWFDDRLTWKDDATYENIGLIFANVDDIWKPNMNVFNSGRAEQYRNTEMPLFITRNGHVWWTTMGDFHFVCAQEGLRWYPLDTHICRLSLGSLYPQDVFSKMFLYDTKTAIHGVEQLYIIENLHWDLLSMVHSKNATSVSEVMIYPTDDFTFEICRQGWPLLTAFLPLTVCLVFLSWTTFTLPPRGEPLSRRMAVSTTTLFLSSVFLLVLIKTVSGIGNRPPVIVKVSASIVLLESFTCLHNVFIANVLQKSTEHLKVLRKLPVQVLRVLGLNKPGERGNGDCLLVNEESPLGAGVEQFQLEPGPEDSWILVGYAYDKLHLFLQVIVLILLVAFLCLV